MHKGVSTGVLNSKNHEVFLNFIQGVFDFLDNQTGVMSLEVVHVSVYQYLLGALELLLMDKHVFVGKPLNV